MTTEEVLKIWDDFRVKNGRSPTSTEVATILAGRWKRPVDVCDVEEVLQTALKAGLLSLNEEEK